MPTSFRTPVVRPARRCAATPRSGPAKRSSASPIAATGATRGSSAPTTQPTSGSRRPRWLIASGPNASEDVAQLARAVDEPAEVAPGRRGDASGSSTSSTVRPAAQGVVRHPRLAAEPGGDREARAAGAGGTALRWPDSGSRSSRPVPSRISDGCGALDDAEAASLPLGERGDGEVGPLLEQRPEVADQVGVAEEQRAVGRGPLGQRQRLSLAAAGQPQDPGAGRVRLDRGSVARAVVGDDHVGVGELLAEGCDRRPDPTLLVAGGDQDRQALSHPRRGGRDLGQARRRVRSSSRRTAPGAAPPSSSARASRPDCESRSSTRREVLLGERVDRRRPGPRHLDADGRHVRRGEPRVEAGEKARRRAALRA